MPTYEYLCEACGHKFEKFQPITAAALRKCPHCGKQKLKRLIGAGSGMIFRGSGFYTTDYRDSAYKEKAKADTASASGDSKPETKSESKGESKTESKSESKPAETTPSAKPAESKPAAAEQSASTPQKVERPKKK